MKGLPGGWFTSTRLLLAWLAVALLTVLFRLESLWLILLG